MRRLILITSLLLALGAIAGAQEFSKADIFAGYQYTKLDAFGVQSVSLNGWNGQFTRYFHRNLGLTGEVTGLYGTPNVGGFPTKLRVYTFMGGPTLRVHFSKTSPFVHALFGAVRASADDGALAMTAFGWELGGGLDLPMTETVYIRPAQIDYLGTKFNYSYGRDAQNNFRYAAGVVFKF